MPIRLTTNVPVGTRTNEDLRVTKKLIKALQGERQDVPPVWIMRQAGRYLPEYRATRAKAGDFLSLCYTPELAAEVTLQPIRRFDFDAAILFADILLVPQALGADLWFVEGEGPRLSTVTQSIDFNALAGPGDIHDTLDPIYETINILRGALPASCTLIGFAGAPWTVATYMIAGRGTPDQGPAHHLKSENPRLFTALLDRLTEATIEYLSAQADAGAEVLKIFDSWAGSLQGPDFQKFAVEPAHRIISALKTRHPAVPIIAFPREAGKKYDGFAQATGADCLALDTSVDRAWAAKVLQPRSCVQGNLDPRLLVTGGEELVQAARVVRQDFSGGPHIFNLGHGITPDADPDNVLRLLEAVREPA